MPLCAKHPYQFLFDLTPAERKDMGIVYLSRTHLVEVDTSAGVHYASLDRFMDGKSLMTFDKALVKDVKAETLRPVPHTVYRVATLLKATGVLWETHNKTKPWEWCTLATALAERPLGV